MKIRKQIFELYKWIPFVLMANCFRTTYENYKNAHVDLLYIAIFLVFIIPFVFIHSMICRHIYSKHKKGNYYEF
jgi:ABC-type polysaccharide/polyol phosphate export permease